MEDNMKIFDNKLKKLENCKTINQSNSVMKDMGNNQQESLEIKKLKNEIMYKDMLIEELNEKLSRWESGSKNKEEISLNKRNDDELTHLIRVNEKLNHENNSLRKLYREKEDENSMQLFKINDLEKDLRSVEVKLAAEESKFKSLKIEFDSIVKTSNNFTKQIESLKSKLEDLKAENESLVIENSALKKKVAATKKTLNKSYVTNEVDYTNNFDYKKNFVSNSLQEFNTHKSLNNPIFQRVEKNSLNEVYYPSEFKIKESKNEMIFLEEKLSLLLNEKKVLENEILKQSEKSRTLNEMKKRKHLENTLLEKENSINEIKSRMRKLNLNK